MSYKVLFVFRFICKFSFFWFVNLAFMYNHNAYMLGFKSYFLFLIIRERKGFKLLTFFNNIEKKKYYYRRIDIFRTKDNTQSTLLVGFFMIWEGKFCGWRFLITSRWEFKSSWVGMISGCARNRTKPPRDICTRLLLKACICFVIYVTSANLHDDDGKVKKKY